MLVSFAQLVKANCLNKIPKIITTCYFAKDGHVIKWKGNFVDRINISNHDREYVYIDIIGRSEHIQCGIYSAEFEIFKLDELLII